MRGTVAKRLRREAFLASKGMPNGVLVRRYDGSLINAYCTRAIYLELKKREKHVKDQRERHRV